MITVMRFNFNKCHIMHIICIGHSHVTKYYLSKNGALSISSLAREHVYWSLTSGYVRSNAAKLLQSNLGLGFDSKDLSDER